MSLSITSFPVARLAASPAAPAAAAGPGRPATSAGETDASSTTRGDSFVPSGARTGEEEAGDGTTAAPSAGSATPAAGEAQEPTGGRAAGQPLSVDELRMITELQARDRDVRAHEAAHQAAGGGAVGGASYTYQQGPDGRQYAVGGEVPVDLSTSGGSPEATLAKMARVRAAAMAPADPSPQDFAVAAAAAAIEAVVRQDQRAKATESRPAAGAGKAEGQTTGRAASGEGATGNDRPAGSVDDASGAAPPALTGTASASPPSALPSEDRSTRRALAAYRAAVGDARTPGIDHQA